MEGEGAERVDIPNNVRASLDPVVKNSGRTVADKVEETHCEGRVCVVRCECVVVVEVVTSDEILLSSICTKCRTPQTEGKIS